MKRVQSILAKTMLLAAAGFGLSACVAVAPEPVPYYAAPAYYPSYYAPRPAYNSYFFYYDNDRGRGDHHRGRGHRGWR